MLVAFATSLSTRCRVAGSPPRRAGNFSLLRQRKVTKREALNRTPAPHARAAPCNSRSLRGQTRPAALSLLSLSPAPFFTPSARLTRGCTPCSREIQTERRSGDAITAQHPPRRRPSDAALVFPGEPGVQPALGGVKWRAMALVIRTAARAQRVASAHKASGRFRTPLIAASRSCAVQGLFFGDFLLAPQKKVTPLPGGTPGNAPSQHALRQSNRKAAPRQR
jgi:hypothetical protein